MNEQANPKRDADSVSSPKSNGSGTNEHWVEVPGGSIYYRCQGSGRTLVLGGGGPANADTLATLAAELADDYAVVTYDRRGYSRSRVDDRERQISISDHGEDLRQLVADLGTAPVSIFGTSFGALIALDLIARAPEMVDVVIAHEPPLGELLAGDERVAFNINLEAQPDAGSALDAIAASIGVTRGLAGGGSCSRRALRQADVELFIRRDVPAIGAYVIDLDQLDPVANRIVVMGSDQSRGFYPYRCAQRLADHLGTPLVEVPGNHAGMVQRPDAFAERMRSVLGDHPMVDIPTQWTDPV
jgi:pimeloyl-ACP methyl ester carboxylesterase